MIYKEYLKTDFDYIVHWHNLRNLPIPEETATPVTGVVALDHKNPICIAFLRRIEGGYAQIDGLITNPEAESHIRNEALDGVLLYLIMKASDIGVKGICSYSKDEHSIERAKRLGFTDLNHTVLGLIIQKNNNT